jgi:hypothetical protein
MPNYKKKMTKQNWDHYAPFIYPLKMLRIRETDKLYQCNTRDINVSKIGSADSILPITP